MAPPPTSRAAPRSDAEGLPLLELWLQRTKKVQNRLLVVNRQIVEVADHAVGLGSRVRRITMAWVRRRRGREMLKDGLKQIRRSSVVQEEGTLTAPPERSCSKLVGTSLALDDVVREFRAHVVQHQVGKQIDRPVLQNRAEHDRRRLHLRRMAQSASDSLKDDSASLGARARMRGGRAPGREE